MNQPNPKKDVETAKLNNSHLSHEEVSELVRLVLQASERPLEGIERGGSEISDAMGSHEFSSIIRSAHEAAHSIVVSLMEQLGELPENFDVWDRSQADDQAPENDEKSFTDS